MAQKHNWSKKKGDAWCTRKGCDAVRVSTETDGLPYKQRGVWRSKPDSCSGDSPKTEKSGKHDWDKNFSEWRSCRNKDCPWQFNARKGRYRVRGAARMGEVSKALPCKGAP